MLPGEGETQETRTENCSSAASSTTNIPRSDPGLNPRLCYEKPASNRLRYGMNVVDMRFECFHQYISLSTAEESSRSNQSLSGINLGQFKINALLTALAPNEVSVVAIIIIIIMNA
jgi:hypothetical protein